MVQDGQIDLVAGAAARYVLTECGGFRPGERIVLIADEASEAVADLFAKEVARLTDAFVRVDIPTAKMHGEEPTVAAAAAMCGGDLVLGVTRLSLAHSAARRAAAEAGARYLSLADYSIGLLCDPALTVDYRAQAERVRAVADLLTNAADIHITSPLGTDVTLSAVGRAGNACPGFVRNAGDLGSPPDIEANISPLEGCSEGVIVIDGSIPHPEIGLLETPIQIDVKAGFATRIDGHRKTVEVLESLFASRPPAARILAELGFGLNPAARLTGSMLTDEGVDGSIHFGFGSNDSVGGVNHVDFHLDFVMLSPTVIVDNFVLLETGRCSL